jgi:tartrate dehydratase beta subunit/fumarate hydratase class I family protein
MQGPPLGTLYGRRRQRYEGCYLIAAALIASRNIIYVKVIDDLELAMEAACLLEVKDLRLFAG